MLARSALLLIALLLVVAAVSNVLSPHGLRTGTGASSLGAAAGAGAQRGGVQPGTVTAAVPDPRPIRAKVGDVVSLSATAPGDDVVDLPDLGVDAPVGPGEPAQLQLVADRAGRFPVVLRYSGRRVGTLVVKPAS